MEKFYECPKCGNLGSLREDLDEVCCGNCDEFLSRGSFNILNASDVEIEFLIESREVVYYETRVYAPNEYEARLKFIRNQYNKKDRIESDTTGEEIDDLHALRIVRKGNKKGKLRNFDIDRNMLDLFNRLQHGERLSLTEDRYNIKGSIMVKNDKKLVFSKDYNATIIDFLKEFIMDCDTYVEQEELFSNNVIISDKNEIKIEGDFRFKFGIFGYFTIIIERGEE